MRILSDDKKKRLCSHYTPDEDNPHKGTLCQRPATYACARHDCIVVDRCDEHSQVFPHRSPIAAA